MTAHAAFKLETLGRTGAWVAYSDGAYRHVVRASHYDREVEEPADDYEAQADAYTAWCDTGRERGYFAADRWAKVIAKRLGLNQVHSAYDGLCSRLEVQW